MNRLRAETGVGERVDPVGLGPKATRADSAQRGERSTYCRDPVALDLGRTSQSCPGLTIAAELTRRNLN